MIDNLSFNQYILNLHTKTKPYAKINETRSLGWKCLDHVDHGFKHLRMS